MGHKLNWQRGLSRIENMAALALAVLNFIYAIKEGLVCGWHRLSCGIFIQKQVAWLIAKVEQGTWSDVLFIATHSLIIFAIARVVFYLINKAILWCIAGFRRHH